MTDDDILRRAALELRLLRDDEYQSHRDSKTGRCDADLEGYFADLDAVVAGLERMRETLSQPTPAARKAAWQIDI